MFYTLIYNLRKMCSICSLPVNDTLNTVFKLQETAQTAKL